MQSLRSHLALLLLLCLTRTLLPEAWILALHTHAHTTAEPAHSPAFRHKGKTLLSAKHQHCGVEQFYNVPFQAGVSVAAPGPRVRPGYAQALTLGAERTVLGQLQRPQALRGPPRRG